TPAEREVIRVDRDCGVRDNDLPLLSRLQIEVIVAEASRRVWNAEMDEVGVGIGRSGDRCNDLPIGRNARFKAGGFCFALEVFDCSEEMTIGWKGLGS